MGIKIDITQKDLKTVKDLLKQYLPNTLVWAFGSRVKFTAKPASDLDLAAFISKEQKLKFSLLKEALEESSIPFRIDLHNWYELPETFHKNIESSFVVLQEDAKEEMPSQWKTYKLGELIELKRGYDLPDYNRVKGEFPVYTSSGFSSLHNEAKVEAPGVITGRYGTLGEIFFTEKDYWPHNTTLYVKDFKGNNPKFIYYFLKTLRLESGNDKSSVPGLNRNDLHRLDVSIPDLSTQTQIAQILSSLDDKIELNLQMNQTLEAMAQALFKEWFVNFNFPNFDGVLENGLPKGWRMGKLGEVVRIEIGRTPPRLEEEWFSKDEKDNKWISIRDMGQSGMYIFNTSEYLTNEAIEKFRIPVIPENTVILSFKLTIGRLAITTEKMLSNEAIAQINSTEFSPEYIYLYLKTYNWGSLGSTSSIATAVNSKTIKEMEILIPDTDISNLFKEVITPLFEKIKYNSLQIQTLTQTRDTLLPKLMSGKIELI